MFESLSYILISLVFLTYTFTNNTLGTLTQNNYYLNKIFSTPRLVGLTFEKDLTAASGAVVEQQTNTILWQKDKDLKKPIASLTKLMFAEIFLESQPDWEKQVLLEPADFQKSGSKYLKLNEQLSVRDLFHTALIASDNVAVSALVRTTGLSESQFVERMNQQARLWGMTNTEFFDATGLAVKNQSTVSDLIILAKIAFNNPYIQDALNKKTYLIKVGPKNQTRTITSTNKLLGEQSINFLYGKTGSTTEAGNCLISEFLIKDFTKVIIILLGSQSDELRFSETKLLAEWVNNNFEF